MPAPTTPTEILGTTKALIKDRSVELRTVVPEQLPAVWADPQRVRQVLLNWDIAAIVLLLVAVISMFEVVIKRLMVDARLDDYQDVVEVVD